MICRVVTDPGWFLAQSLPQTHKTVGLFFMTAVALLRGITPAIAVAVSFPVMDMEASSQCLPFSASMYRVWRSSCLCSRLESSMLQTSRCSQLAGKTLMPCIGACTSLRILHAYVYAAQDFEKNVLKCYNDYKQLFAEFEDLLCKHTKHSSVKVIHAKGPLAAAELKSVSQSAAVLVLPCRTPKPLDSLRATLAKAKPAKVGLFLDEADAVWSHLPDDATNSASQRVQHFYGLFASLSSLHTVVQVGLPQSSCSRC